MRAGRKLAAVAGLVGLLLATGLVMRRLRGPRFVVYPEAVAAQVKDPHASQGAPLCQACHPAADAALRGDALAVCARCHPFEAHRSHVVGVPPLEPPASAQVSLDL